MLVCPDIVTDLVHAHLFGISGLMFVTNNDSITQDHCTNWII